MSSTNFQIGTCKAKRLVLENEQTMAKNPHAAALGRKGGKVKSKAKSEAARRNWLKALAVIKQKKDEAA